MAKKKATQPAYTEEEVKQRADQIEAQSDPNGPLVGVFSQRDFMTGFMFAVSDELRERKKNSGTSSRRTALDVDKE